ncbi:hypothetical protein HELRODRAFT_178286 [Helobdella robusta]|uniref:Uncharacterized protein n=1 Tax=Helobdella robusta TaxID=6412 RepID=T1FD13_HELRO|nr:hypothetical protein HELRODRAFT_178286 [Helobdella robusta]ESN97177.1 hypothetical protein HELRODRAFT_178286 [Helobdella robusta]
MSKWKQSYESGRRYKEKWEKQFTWLEKMSNGSENAFCKLCCKILQPKLSTLINHSKTADHIRQEEFYQLELSNQQDEDTDPPHKLLRLSNGEDLSFDDDDWSNSNLEPLDDSKVFGMWLADQLRSLNSDSNREKLKGLIEKVVNEVRDLDSSETTTDQQSGCDDSDVTQCSSQHCKHSKT